MKYHFFWKGYLSNWYKSPFTVKIKILAMGELMSEKEVEFNCGEQYMMYSKALLMGDVFAAESILKESNPREQKRLGREIKNFDQERWNEFKYPMMLHGLRKKFEQNPDLKEKLLSEDCDLFVEASPEDRIWGIGYAEEDALENKENWGENLLGRIITDIRNKFLDSSENQVVEH